VTAEPDKPMTPDPKEKLFVKEIILGEDDEEVKAALGHIVAPYLNHELTMAQINEVVGKVTR
jgi:hypothetical protein